MSADRSVPNDLIAEESVLGACLLSNDAIDTAASVLTPADFYRPLHQRAFELIVTLRTANQPVDPVTVAPGLDGEMYDGETAVGWLHGLTIDTPSVSGVSRYAQVVLNNSKWRSLIWMGAELADAGYEHQPAAQVAERYASILSDHELLRRHEGGPIPGYYHDIADLDTGEDRDDMQPWIARGLLRRGQRLLLVAKAGIGKSTLLRQLAFCAANGVHPWTGQRSERPRRTLVVELEAGEWDVVDSNRSILFALRRICDAPSVRDLHMPSLLHRPGGIDIRSASGRATIEGAIQRAQPELVVMGPVKYMSLMQPGENYETAALALHATLNDMLSRYSFALGLEAHFSRGDHGAPGGSERWVDWPDVGFGIHPPETDDHGIPNDEFVVKPFRIPRDSNIWLPGSLRRGVERRLPWSCDDHPDPHNPGRSLFAEKFGGVRELDYGYHQGEL